MVGVHHLGQDVDLGDAVLHVVGHHVVVDAPAEVLATSTGAEAPPAVTVGFLHQVTETVDIAIAEEVGHPLAFLGQEARRGIVFPRVVDVDVLVADVVVARKHKVGALFPQRVDIVAEEVEPYHLEGLAFVARGARGMVDAHHREVAEVGTEETPFVVVQGFVHAVNHVVRLLFRDEAHAAVAFLLGREPIVVVAHHLEVHQRDLVGRGFQLLEAEHIGLVVVDPLQQALVDGRTDAVHVVADNLHGVLVMGYTSCRNYSKICFSKSYKIFVFVCFFSSL